ncbi:MAG TPA: hypothetical protein P5274_00685 [Candidatus Paceibacterota bacterium]|nr:hypothetical protein [Candidatus Paceibacterota bacterium]
MDDLKLLVENLNLSVGKKDSKQRSVSLAQSESGAHYLAGSVDSDNKLLGISSEQAVLGLSTLAQDYKVHRIITLRESDEKVFSLSPIIAKIIIDYSRRTGKTIEYSVVNTSGNKLFYTPNLSQFYTVYQPTNNLLTRINSDIKASHNWLELPTQNLDYPKILKEYAIKGLERNFPTSEGTSGYGTAVITKSGRLYYGGQYSSFDERLGLHSEMNVIISALMNKDDEITHLGLVSTKYTDSPCFPCGGCRQFLGELSTKFNWDLKILCFAKETDNLIQRTISDLLPDLWTSKKW